MEMLQLSTSAHWKEIFWFTGKQDLLHTSESGGEQQAKRLLATSPLHIAYCVSWLEGKEQRFD